MPKEKAVALATALTEGRWTHGFPITVPMARQLGFPVTTTMPRTVYDLMDLYPQAQGDGPRCSCPAAPPHAGAARDA